MKADSPVRKIQVTVVKDWLNEGVSTRLKGPTLWLWEHIQPIMSYNQRRVVVSKQKDSTNYFCTPANCLANLA